MIYLLIIKHFSLFTNRVGKINSRKLFGWIVLVGLTIGVVWTYTFMLSEGYKWGIMQFSLNAVIAIIIISAVLLSLTPIMVKKGMI